MERDNSRINNLILEFKRLLNKPSIKNPNVGEYKLRNIPLDTTMKVTHLKGEDPKIEIYEKGKIKSTHTHTSAGVTHTAVDETCMPWIKWYNKASIFIIWAIITILSQLWFLYQIITNFDVRDIQLMFIYTFIFVIGLFTAEILFLRYRNYRIFNNLKFFKDEEKH